MRLLDAIQPAVMLHPVADAKRLPPSTGVEVGDYGNVSSGKAAMLSSFSARFFGLYTR